MQSLYSSLVPAAAWRRGCGLQRNGTSVAYTGAEIKATIIGAATKRALQFEGERAVTIADMITAAERVERNQEPGRARTVGF
jgi:hypothetical protein